MNRLTNNAGSRTSVLGFTLIELMIVVAIISILASIAYPAYQEYGRRAKRSEARAHLMYAAARMERYYSDNNQYTTVMTSAGTNIDTKTSGKYYDIAVSISDGNNQTFTLTATASFDDSECLTLTLDNTGAKDSTGTGSECWDK